MGNVYLNAVFFGIFLKGLPRVGHCLWLKTGLSVGLVLGGGVNKGQSGPLFTPTSFNL